MQNSYHLDSSAPESVLLGDYQLALKSFINKDISRSFGTIRKLQPIAYRSFSNGQASESIYTKITNLYLTELGLLLKPGLDENATLCSQDQHELVISLQNEEISKQITELYGSAADAPPALVFQVFLVYYTCQDVLQQQNRNFVLEKFTKLYHSIDFSEKQNDVHLRRWFDMYVLNVLPEAGDFDTAFSIAKTNLTFGGELALIKLKEVQELSLKKRAETEKQSKALKAREAKRLAAESERKKKEAQEKNLKYRTMKQIQAGQKSEETTRETSSPKSSEKAPLTLERMRERLLYYYTLTKGTLQQNSPVILAAIVLLFVSSKVLRARKINFKQKFKETMQMAFKVTYL